MTLEATRITLARERAGLSKVELARRIEATARTIANYEQFGAPDAMDRVLASTLGCRTSFFRLPAAHGIDSQLVFFRARRRSTSAQRKSAAALGRIGTDLYRMLDHSFGLPDVAVPDLAVMNARSAAQQLRVLWDLGVAPLPNLIQLAESRGIRVLSLPKASAEVDAFSFWDEGRPYIFLSLEKTAERSRFDIAHELGHLVLHAGLGQMPADIADAERQANDFASEFLMPRVELRTKVPREPRLEQVLMVKRHFGVSAMALVYSAHSAGILSDWTYRVLMQELNDAGYKFGEPQGMQREASRVFAGVFPSLRVLHGTNAAAIADRLGLLAEDLNALTFGQVLVAMPETGAEQKSSAPRRGHLRVVP
ncbi:ImmA/IrrE family metallo-endopeptidase [Glutamicibacter endophyticus]